GLRGRDGPIEEPTSTRIAGVSAGRTPTPIPPHRFEANAGNPPLRFPKEPTTMVPLAIIAEATLSERDPFRPAATIPGRPAGWAGRAALIAFLIVVATPIFLLLLSAVIVAGFVFVLIAAANWLNHSARNALARATGRDRAGRRNVRV